MSNSLVLLSRLSCLTDCLKPVSIVFADLSHFHTNMCNMMFVCSVVGHNGSTLRPVWFYIRVLFVAQIIILKMESIYIILKQIPSPLMLHSILTFHSDTVTLHTYRQQTWSCQKPHACNTVAMAARFSLVPKGNTEEVSVVFLCIWNEWGFLLKCSKGSAIHTVHVSTTVVMLDYCVHMCMNAC